MKVKVMSLYFFTLPLIIFTLLLFSRSTNAESDVYKIVDGKPEYIIGPEDVLEIIVKIGSEEKKYEVIVMPTGYITVSFVSVKADGLTVRELEELLNKEFLKFVKEPQIFARVKEFRSKKVMITGAVQALRAGTGAGIYYLSGKTTLFELLVMAGGHSPDANLKDIRIQRKDGTVLNINIFEFLSEGKIENDPEIMVGDRVYVPSTKDIRDMIFVFGEVKNPGAYPFSQGLTAVQAVGLAGGYTDIAVLEDTRIIRGRLDNPAILPANVESVIKKGETGKDVTLAKNDIIYIPRSRIGDWNAFLSKLRPTLDFIILPLIGAYYWRDLERRW
jgi:polysaccharide export outer membrane protein